MRAGADGVAPDHISYNATMQACAKAQRAGRALALLGEMRERGLEPDVPSYNCAISAVGKDAAAAGGGGGWDGSRALALLAEMRRHGLEPSEVQRESRRSEPRHGREPVRGALAPSPERSRRVTCPPRECGRTCPPRETRPLRDERRAAPSLSLSLSRARAPPPPPLFRAKQTSAAAGLGGGVLPKQAVANLARCLATLCVRADDATCAASVTKSVRRRGRRRFFGGQAPPPPNGRYSQ